VRAQAVPTLLVAPTGLLLLRCTDLTCYSPIILGFGVSPMKRCEFIARLAGAVALPVAARGQQSSMPVVGFLSAVSEVATVKHQTQFHRGLRETGFVPGQNVAIEYRSRREA